jgi:hypothetical protein
MDKKTYLKTRNEKLEKNDKFKSLLPELFSCEQIINRHSKSLLTMFPNLCEKDWDEGQHLLVQIKTGHKLSLLSTTNIQGLIDDNTRDIKPDTLIMGEEKNGFVLFYWRNRYKIEKWIHITENKDNLVILQNNSNKTVPYIKEKLYENDKYKKIGEVQRFEEQSLIVLMLKKSRKKGTLNSNQNSAAQSRRKSNKIVSGKGVKLCFDFPYGYKEDNKNKLDSYKISVSYGFKGSYRTFVRQLNKGSINLDKGNLQSLTVNLINNQEIDINENNNLDNSNQKIE